MKSKLVTLLGATLFVFALDLSASASTYDISGQFPFPFSSDTFSGTIDVSGSSVTAADITLSGPGINLSFDELTDVAFSNEVGSIYNLLVDNALYSLGFTFTLPDASNNETGLLGFAVLTEYFQKQICGPDKTNCHEVTIPKVIRVGGYGDVTLTSVIGPPGGDNATPLPTTLPLFATGLGALGLMGWRRKRKAKIGLASA